MDETMVEVAVLTRRIDAISTKLAQQNQPRLSSMMQDAGDLLYAVGKSLAAIEDPALD